jgi:hypothetical protein
MEWRQLLPPLRGDGRRRLLAPTARERKASPAPEGLRGLRLIDFSEKQAHEVETELLRTGFADADAGKGETEINSAMPHLLHPHGFGDGVGNVARMVGGPRL